MGQKLGQHFLVRGSVLQRIASAACPAPGGLVIEIGPGRGALTAYLLRRAARVVVIELDAHLAGHLRERFRGDPALSVVEGDVLRTDLSQWGRASIVGNLPYYITSPIITRILELGPLLERAVVLVQSEVADRLAARPGNRDYGFLTVQTGLFAAPEILFRVPASAFRPPPKVESAVVRLTPHPEPGVTSPKGFLEFVSQCFRQKRKTLRNNLVGIYGRSLVDSLPEASLRAEQLSLEQFKHLYARMSAI